MPESSDDSDILQRRGRVKWRPLLTTVVIFVTICGGVVWWQDGPLRQIASQLDAGNFESAHSLASQFLVKHPRDSRARILKARSLTGLQRHNAADRLFQEIARDSNGFPDDPAALNDWAVSLLHLEQWPRAIAILRILQNDLPSSPDVLYRLTVAQIRTRQYEGALETARKLVVIDGHQDEANVMIGTINHDRGNRRGALDTWKKILHHNPDARDLQISSGKFLAMVGEEQLELGEPQIAVTTLEKSLSTEPVANTYALIGKAYEQTGNSDQAKASWQKALDLDNSNMIAREELANVALQERQPQQAIELLKPLSDSKGFASSSAYLLQRAYAQMKDTANTKTWREKTNALREVEKQRSQITELIRTSSDPFWSGFLHAYQLADQGKWKAAEVIVRDLLLQKPQDQLLQSLAEAVRTRSNLPSLDTIISRLY